VKNWREKILKEFTPGVTRLTLVSDPDELLLEEKILDSIRNKGFELMSYEDPVEFRYAYESKFRSLWDRGDKKELIVVFKTLDEDFNSVPYDLFQSSRKLSFDLCDIFPQMSYPVIASLHRHFFDDLFKAQTKHNPGHLSDNSTKEFVLRHVFEIAPELIKDTADLLHTLLRRHYQKQQVPDMLDKRFLQILRQNQTWNDWDLEQIISDREAFFDFLQERWLLFLEKKLTKSKSEVGTPKAGYNLKYQGPSELPFDHHDVKIYIDNLFTEGYLKAVKHQLGDQFSSSWENIGVEIDKSKKSFLRLEKLIKASLSALPSKDERHNEWFQFVRLWAELIVNFNDHNEDMPAPMKQEYYALQGQIDQRFSDWLLDRYAGLINLPPTPPVMLHHVTRFLARQIEKDNQCKIAMILMDGLSLDQWIIIRNVLSVKRSDMQFREDVVFSWIPTITSVSRQSLFAGKAPIFFPDSVHRTDKEPLLWTQFWVDQGLSQQDVAYFKGLGDGELENIEDALGHPSLKVIGLIIDKVDKIISGMELGTKGMHNQVQQWAQQSYLANLIDILIHRDFRIFLTSDHGNIEAKGIGNPKEGSIADLRGFRVRVYSDKTLRSSIKTQYPESIEWPSTGLPENYYPLIAHQRSAYVRKSEKLVCHGGIALEEVIVPFVEIEKKES